MNRLVCMIALIALSASAAGAELRVVTDFEGGNAEVVRIDPATSTVRIMPAIREGRGWPCWWYLQLEGVSPGQTVTLEVQAQTAQYAPGRRLAPTWCQPKHASISTDNVAWTPSARAEITGDKVAIYRIPITASPTWIAWGPPFLPSQAEALVTDLAARLPDATKFELARTRNDRPVWGIRIGKGDAPRQVWVNARQHAWETGGSWVGRGFINWIASDDPAATQFRAQTCVHFIPIMDVDNVAIGAGGKDAIPRDHNRDWAGPPADGPGTNPEPQPQNRPVYPEVAAAQRMITAIDRQQGLDVYIDLHNPGHDDPIFFFGPFDLDQMTEVAKRNYTRWIDLASAQIKRPLAVQPKYRMASYVTSQEERSRMSSGWVREHTGDRTISVTLETAWNSPVITQESYQLVGRQLAQTLARYLQEDPRRTP